MVMSTKPYQLSIHVPYNNFVGLNFSTEFTNWIDDPSIKFDPHKKCEYTYDRMKVCAQDFKLIRVYSLLVAGWEKTYNMSPEGFALLNLLKYDATYEGIMGTTLSKDWFMVKKNVEGWMKVVFDQLNNHTSQIKTILIGNEVNANGYTPADIATIMQNFKDAQAIYGLSIPVTVSFNNLPVQSGDPYSDSLVKAVVDNWHHTWNDAYPFVFIDPYPDAAGINDPAGVYKWQAAVYDYYNPKYPMLQIFIGETGAEGAADDAEAIPIINGIFQQLTIQYQRSHRAVPTMMFEALDEPKKGLNPNQRHMGLYKDTDVPANGSSITVKSGVNIPQWIK